MKTKLLSLLAGVACIAALTTSCIKETSGSGDDGTPTLGEGEGYISIIIQDVSTKAPGDLVENPGTADESNINSIRIVLYETGASGLASKYVWDLVPTDLKSQTSPYQTVAEKIEKKDYKLLIMLNPTQEAKDETEIGKTYTEFAAARTDQTVEKLTKNTNTTDLDNFMMSNWQGLVDVKKDTHIHDNEQDAETSPVTGIYMERVVAKILSGYQDTGITSPGATVDGIEWAVDTKNLKTYLIRRTTQAITTPGNSPVLGPEYTTPVMRHRHYAEDPNFTGLSWKDQTTGPPLTADFTPIAADADFKALPQATGPGGGLGGDGSSEYGIEYVLENSMEAAEQWRDVTTAIVYRLKYSPDESSLKRDPATNTVAIGVDKSYFVFGSFVIAPKDLDDIYDGVFTIDPLKYPDLAALLTKTKLGDYKTALGMAASDTFVDFSADPANDSQAVGTDGVEYIDEEQINYYRWPIRHFENAINGVKMGHGRFGVVRNNIYLVHLEAVNGPGSFEPKNNGSDEDMEGYISIRFEILQWTVREQGASVG